MKNKKNIESTRFMPKKIYSDKLDKMHEARYETDEQIVNRLKQKKISTSLWYPHKV